MAASHRISLALDAELKSRMDAVSASNVIRPNWSALFRARVETELANLEQQRGDQTAAIARLRASKLENEQHDLIDGRAHGRPWAGQRADYRALKRLVKGGHQYKNAWDYPWEWLCKAVDPYDLATDEELCAHLFGDQFSDRREYETYLWSVH
jgi:3-mercaptopyruvate sulfurtransferase SseA